MRAVIQRVKRADVLINNSERRSIKEGLAVLIGVGEEDSELDVKLMSEKIVNLRIFSDENDKLNLSLLDRGGDMLVVSNFTLYADCSHGRRPSFLGAAKPPKAVELYQLFLERVRSLGPLNLQTGEFGADMELTLCNDGPITITLDSEDLK